MRRAERPLGRRLGAAALTGAVAAAAAGCSTGPVLPEDSDAAVATSVEDSAVPNEPEVHLEAEESGSITQRGSADVAIETITLGTGTLDVTSSGSERWAIDFPPYVQDAAHYPRAVLRVSNAGADDDLDPAGRDITWGADIRIDRVSAGNGVDNGDNIVQRGLSGDPAFFKAELDEDRAACTVTGRAGTLVVRANEFVRPERWYRVRCSLTGDQLAVYVAEVGEEETGRTYASRVQGRVGTVSFSDPTTPLTVGGKIGEDGQVIRSETDQFNGLVRDPYLALSD